MPDRFLSLKPRPNEDYLESLTLVISVIDAYTRVFEISDTATFNSDDEAPPQRVNYPGSPACHFKIDVERTTSRILADAPDLQRAWFDLAQDLKIAPKLEHRLVRRLSRAYGPLNPGLYFRPSKRVGSTIAAERLRRIAA